MAEIVLGIGTSHSPMLSLAPAHWDIRTDADRAAPAHPYRGETYSFEELKSVRDTARYTALDTLENREASYAACQRHLDALARKLAEADPDVLIIVGDDQKEWFFDDVQPAFVIYHGSSIRARAVDASDPDLPPPMLPVRLSYWPAEDTDYPVDGAFAEHIILQTIEDRFDVTSSRRPPADAHGPRTIGHAFGFIYRRLLEDRPIPFVPILINTYFPPNQPTAARCHEIGRSIARAVKSWEADTRVAVIASGGLTHFVIDEAFDRKLLDAMLAGDRAAMTEDGNEAFQSGTSEIKNWIAACGILEDTGLEMTLLDYVPCYRSEVGTGTGMAFATWT